ncbi:MAG TPA: MAB_1171c family putative transporter [Planosporangium sp.]|nr:MAB_1171c family putative transporter [Planosporangium sp.]
MAPVLLACIAVALWIGVLNKVVQLWRAPEDLPLRALAACVLSATLTFTVNLPPLKPLLDQAGGGIRSLVINFGTMAAAYFLLAFFTYSVRGQAARRAVRLQAVPLVAGILVAFAAWALASPAVRADPADTANGASPHATVFVVAVLGYMAYAHSQSLRWSIAYLRAAGTARLRRGLVVISVAVGAFLVADATKSLLAVLQAATELAGGAVRVFDVVYLTGVGVGTLAFVVGVSYAAVTGMLVSLPLWRTHRRYYRQLEPLWTAMDQAFPHLVLGRVPATSWRGRLGVGSTHYRFYRRVVEIRDGLVQLGPYYDTSSTEHAAAEREEVRWAMVIRAALRAKETESPVLEADPVFVPGGDDLESDARLLVGIARELAVR